MDDTKKSRWKEKSRETDEAKDAEDMRETASPKSQVKDDRSSFETTKDEQQRKEMVYLKEQSLRYMEDTNTMRSAWHWMMEKYCNASKALYKMKKSREVTLKRN